MTMLAADRQTREKAGGTSRTRSGDVAAAAVVFRGALIAKTVTGYIVRADDVAAYKVVGVAQESVDNTAGADGALTVTYLTGIEAEFVNSGGAIVQAGKGARCYVADDQSVTSAALSKHKVVAGIVADFTATLVWVFIDETIERNQPDAVLVNGAVSPAVVSSGAVETIPIAIPDAATTTYVYLNADKIEIVDVQVLKSGAGAANTIQVTDSADAAISDAIAAAVDKASTHAGTLDPAKRVLNANAGFKIVATKAAGSMLALVLIHVIKR